MLYCADVFSRALVEQSDERRAQRRYMVYLCFGALVRAAERWRGLRFTEFELRQLAAVRKELDEE